MNKQDVDPFAGDSARYKQWEKRVLEGVDYYNRRYPKRTFAHFIFMTVFGTLLFLWVSYFIHISKRRWKQNNQSKKGAVIILGRSATTKISITLGGINSALMLPSIQNNTLFNRIRKGKIWAYKNRQIVLTLNLSVI